MALKSIAGTAYFLIDGVQKALKAGLTINPLTVTREAMVGLDGVHGFKKTPAAPSIAVTLSKTEEMSLRSLGAIENSTITAECADGTVFVLSEAFQSGELAFNGEEGTVTATFHGRSCTEIS